MAVKKQTERDTSDYSYLLTHILEDPWDIFNTHTDIKEVVKNAQKSLKDRGLTGFRKSEIKTAILTLKEGLKNRTVDKTLRPLINISKKQWAKHLCNSYRVTTMNALNTLCREVWGSRLPDSCLDEIKTHLHTQEKDEKSKEIDEALSEMFDDVITTVPAPLLEETLKKEVNRSIQLGAISIKASEGSEISIKSLRASDLVGVNNSSSIVIDKVEDGMLFGVKVCF